MRCKFLFVLGVPLSLFGMEETDSQKLFGNYYSHPSSQELQPEGLVTTLDTKKPASQDTDHPATHSDPTSEEEDIAKGLEILRKNTLKRELRYGNKIPSQRIETLPFSFNSSSLFFFFLDGWF